MSVYTLNANSNYGAQYITPANGVIRFEVESEYPITVLVMDADNFAAFRANRKHKSYGLPVQNIIHKQNWTLPFRGAWFLVMINHNAIATAVSFKAWS